MKVVIFCGGKGTRLSEMTDELPKPMIKIGDRPILWHLMKLYKHYGHNEFILLLGYRKKAIEDYFRNSEFNITFLDTGEESNKGERLKMAKKLMGNDEDFLLSYGDDLTDANINKVIEHHKKHGKIVTLTAVRLMSQFGIITTDKDGLVTDFLEKPVLDHLINGGFYVINRKIFNYIKKGYDLEREAFTDLARERQIASYKHSGFWKSMNTLKDFIEFNELWKTDRKWVVWK